MLRRLSPARLPVSPSAVFRVLFLGQGFTSNSLAAVVRGAWNRITSRAPWWAGDHANAIAVYFDDLGGSDLHITQSGLQLTAGTATTSALATYLAGIKIAGDPAVTEMVGLSVAPAPLPGSDAWPAFCVPGPIGGVIIVLVKGTTAGELYQPFGSSDCPLPLVGAVTTGDYWINVPLRGIAQAFGALGDEYELDGPEFDSPAVDPSTTQILAPPNLIVATDAQMLALEQWVASGPPPSDWWPPASAGLPRPHNWVLSEHPPFQFVRHTATTANPPIPGPTTGVANLIEGGGGFRHNVLRGDLDCLMRRIPASPQLPIQDNVDLCWICKGVLWNATTGSPSFDLKDAPRKTMRTQRLEYDRYHWKNVAATSVPVSQTASYSGTGPKWTFSYAANGTDGLKITGIKLANRPDDPFTSAEDCFSGITFKDLQVVYDDGTTASLDFASAFSNTIDPPVLEVADTSDPPAALGGLKLALSWDLDGSWAIDAVLSLVVKDQKNDFDPGGAAMACKLYPQIAMRYRRPSPGAPARTSPLPKVAALKNTVHIDYNNIIPTSVAATMPQDWQDMWGSMCMGQLSMTLATDSNSTDSPLDNNYATAAGKIVYVPPVGVLGDVTWTRKSGRLLAGVSTFFGGKELMLHSLGLPGLPHWSWLFDWVYPGFTGSKRFVGAYASNEPNETRAITERQQSVPWPPSLAGTSNAPAMLVIKPPRQGAYDSVHVSAKMCPDSQGRPTTPAPFCADICIHLHFRWGTIATDSAFHPYAFKGWSTGRLDQGANMARGMPLVPPNQHVDVSVSVPQDETSAALDYVVTAYAPRERDYQVSLEQGLGVAFAYSGLPPGAASVFAVALGVTPPGGLDQDSVRMFFPKAYERIRWYLDAEDGSHDQQVPQDPATGTSTLDTLEAL